MRAGLVGGEGFAIDASVIEADASAGRKVDGKLVAWPDAEKLTRPVREYLAGLQAAAEAAKIGDADNDLPPGNPPAPPKVTSLTDPTAAWTNKKQRKVGFANGANYLIDLQQAIIVDVEATPARWSAEVAATTKANIFPPPPKCRPHRISRVHKPQTHRCRGTEPYASRSPLRPRQHGEEARFAPTLRWREMDSNFRFRCVRRS
jgi:hypothetical protein